jgi:hypothetical protein
VRNIFGEKLGESARRKRQYTDDGDKSNRRTKTISTLTAYQTRWKKTIPDLPLAIRDRITRQIMQATRKDVTRIIREIRASR